MPILFAFEVPFCVGTSACCVGIVVSVEYEVKVERHRSKCDLSNNPTTNAQIAEAVDMMNSHRRKAEPGPNVKSEQLDPLWYRDI